MTKNHTSTPLAVMQGKRGTIVIAAGVTADITERQCPVAIAVIPAEIGGDEDERQSNAARIVACWNACVAISTENLENNFPVLELANLYNDVLRQRDHFERLLDRLANNLGEFAGAMPNQQLADVLTGYAEETFIELGKAYVKGIQK